MRGREEGSEERAEVNKGEILDPFEASLPASLLFGATSCPRRILRACCPSRPFAAWLSGCGSDKACPPSVNVEATVP